MISFTVIQLVNFVGFFKNTECKKIQGMNNIKSTVRHFEISKFRHVVSNTSKSRNVDQRSLQCLKSSWQKFLPHEIFLCYVTHRHTR